MSKTDLQEKVSGSYRDLSDLLLNLAKYYLSCRSDELEWFGNDVNTFLVAIGGDGAPFLKDDTACAWLVSFLNIGRGVLSSDDNFLLFGANCSEKCTPAQRFLKKLQQDILAIENTTWSYEKRLKDAELVRKFKKTVDKKKVTETTKRNNVTQYIASLKSRQEFVPLLGKLVDRAHVDPLHIKIMPVHLRTDIFCMKSFL